MEPPHAARFPLEVLDRIGDVDRVAIYSCLFHAFSEKPSCRSDKRFSRLVFLVSRLFADEHDRRVCGSFAEYGLRGSTEKVASATFHCGSFERRSRCLGRNGEAVGGDALRAMPGSMHFFRFRLAIGKE